MVSINLKLPGIPTDCCCFQFSVCFVCFLSSPITSFCFGDFWLMCPLTYNFLTISYFVFKTIQNNSRGRECEQYIIAYEQLSTKD